jgi:hypothetical protein
MIISHLLKVTAHIICFNIIKGNDRRRIYKHVCINESDVQVVWLPLLIS